MIKQIDRTTKIILTLALLIVVILSIAQAYDIKPILFISLIGFISLVIFSPKEFFLPIMLFYLPWSPIMKLSPDSYTIYTIVLPIFFVYSLLFSKGKENFLLTDSNIILSALIAIMTFSVKLISHSEINLDCCLFIIMLLLIPTYMKQYINKISFNTSIAFLTFGTISACISSKLLVSYPHMLSYIVVETWEQMGLVRLSGFYGDSNFYSIHILISICGLLILSASQKGSSLILPLIGVTILIYFGFDSVSKMFLLTLGIITFIWLVAIFSLNNQFKRKLGIVSGVSAIVIFVLSSNLFAEQINDYIFRFGMAYDASSLTTGRSDIWLNYIKYLSENLSILLFGAGYTKSFPYFNVASHNTIIQMLYQFGLVGITLIAFWFIEFKKATVKRANSKKTASQYCFILQLALACFIPWMALDILFFDEFFYTISLFFIGLNHIANQAQVSSTKQQYCNIG